MVCIHCFMIALYTDKPVKITECSQNTQSCIIVTVQNEKQLTTAARVSYQADVVARAAKSMSPILENPDAFALIP